MKLNNDKIPAILSLAKLINFTPNLKEEHKELFQKMIDKLTEDDNFNEDKINEIFSQIPTLLQTTKIIFSAKQIVKHLEDKDDPHMQDIALLKKNIKHYTSQHIDRIKESQKLYTTTGDKKMFEKLELHKAVFKAFQENPNKTMRMFGAASEYITLTTPEVIAIKKVGTNPRNRASAKKIIQNYNLASEIARMGAYFEGYGLQPKMVYMSAGIKIFKFFEMLYEKAGVEFKDAKLLADAIEDIFFAIDKPIKVYPKKMSIVFIKASIKGVPIYAYASKNKSAVIDIQKMEESIKRKLDSNGAKSIIKQRLYDKLLKPVAGNIEMASFLQ